MRGYDLYDFDDVSRSAGRRSRQRREGGKPAFCRASDFGSGIVFAVGQPVVVEQPQSFGDVSRRFVLVENVVEHLRAGQSDFRDPPAFEPNR